MAGIREIARDYREEIMDGIAWVAIWKTGRAWNARSFWLNGKDSIPADEIHDAERIVVEDPGAIFINEYECAHMGEGTLEDIVAGIRFHYGNGYNKLAAWLDAGDGNSISEGFPPESEGKELGQEEKAEPVGEEIYENRYNRVTPERRKGREHGKGRVSGFGGDGSVGRGLQDYRNSLPFPSSGKRGIRQGGGSRVIQKFWHASVLRHAAQGGEEPRTGDAAPPGPGRGRPYKAGDRKPAPGCQDRSRDR